MEYDLLIFAGAFLLGSIPFSVILGKIFFATDIRKSGSGNPGATNTLRTLGPVAGIFVLLMDMAKGAAAVNLALLVQDMPLFTILELKVLCGGLAVAGHVFSPFLKLKGGKGVATALGMILAAQWGFGLIAILIFILVVYFTRYVSLGSVGAVWSYPIGLLLFYNDSLLTIAVAAGVALLVTLRHNTNIQRLRQGKENVFTWPGSKRTKPA